MRNNDTIDLKVGWQGQLAREFVDAGVDVAAWVPDKRLAPIASELAASHLPIRTLTREEECFGYAAGFRAAGGLPLVLVQCSGLGNSLNALGSLAVPYCLGFPVVVSMRGSLGERNPAQVPLGRATPGLFELLGVQAFSLGRVSEIASTVRRIVAMAQGARVVAPLLLEPELEEA